ncbi:MAG TPA: hypothetical protein VK088_09825 [Acidimicrobiia bacterium]|nr:hypothetical protein [Acidimicrobiia bacterium]
MRVLVAVDGESTTRAAQSLADHPGIGSVAVLAPASSRHFQTVTSAEGFDVVVGKAVAAETAQRAGLPAVVEDELGAGSVGVFGASIVGLALALAADLEGDPLTAVALEGEADGDRTVMFPSPIDSRSVTEEWISGRRVLVGRGEGPLQAAIALGTDRHRVVMDHARFLEGIALAAGVGILLERPEEGAIGVWEAASAYLRTSVEMGLVIGERPAPA